MILTDFAAIPAYRMHHPRWAATPLSGEGAARHGGRANRPGVEALYLALDITTAVLEYQQVSTLLPPGTLVSYRVNVEGVVDFRGGYDPAAWAHLWEDFFCDWRDLWFNQRIEPPSWVIGDEVLAAGAKGILFPSRRPGGGINLVLYPQAFTALDRIEVFDPHHALPKNQDSWA